MFASALIVSLPLAGAEKIDLPKVESFTLSNGVTIKYIHDELPRITIAAMVATGFLYEKNAQAGITEMTAKALSFCGTHKYPGRALAEYTDSTGSRYGISPDWESVTVSYQALDEFTEDAFSVTGGILIDPPLKNENISLAKHLMKEKIAREKEDPMMAAYLAARKLIYGNESYGIRATSATVDGFSIDEVNRYWKDAVCSRNMVIGIASSRPLAEIKALAEKYFGIVPEGERRTYSADRAADFERAEKNAGKVYHIYRDIPQSTIVILSPGADLHNPGADSLDVADQILGGGDFNSKLVREIREKRGLAYGAGSVTRMRDRTGLFMAYSQCDNTKAAEVLSLMRESISDTAGGKISDDEMRLAKQSIVRSYIFAFDSELSVLSRYLSLWYGNFSEDYLTGYPARIEGVTKESVSSAFGSIVNKGYVTVVLGGEKSLEGVDYVELPAE